MRIDELRLTAFGPFTDTVLDLRGGSEGFHLVYGANEAGKSSALRALRQLFYGIPTRSTDNFIHPHPRMRIGASLRTRNGQVLSFVRRKGRLNTLRGPDDETVLDEAQLQRLFPGIDADLFSTMFGIGYEDLVRGGRDILQGGGDVGRLVFAAGSGIANLREIQNRLQADADSLFRPAGQKQVINDAIGRLNRLKKDLKAAQLPSSEWRRHNQALETALSRKATTQAALDESRKTLNRLQRVHQAFPLISGRKGILNDLEGLFAAVRLPEDFPEKRRRIVSELAQAQTRRQQAEQAIQTCTRRISELALSSDLLDSGEIIEEIHLELGSQSKAGLDRVKLETLRATALNDVQELLKELPEGLRPPDAGKMHIRRSDAERIRTLSVHHERVLTRIEEAEKALPDISLDITRIEGELAILPEPPSVSALADALAEAEPYGPLEETVRLERTELDSLRKTLTLLRNRMGLAQVPLEGLERLRVPSSETILAFEERLDALDRRTTEIRTELEKTRGALDEAESSVEALHLTQEVPTEADLSEIRTLRDAGWQIISHILSEQTVPAPQIREFIEKLPGAGTLSQAFETALHRADEVSDRLRREADRVAAKARLLADRIALGHRKDALETERGSLESQRRRFLEDWEGQWQDTGIPCRSPKEMAQWRQEFSNLMERAAEFRTRKARCEERMQRLAAHRAGMARYLGEPAPVGENPLPSLPALIKKAQTLISRQEALTRQREQLLRDRQKRTHELDAARARIQSGREELAGWTRQWESALAPLGLGADARPEQVQTVMDTLQQRAEKLREAGVLRQRIDGIDRDAEAFARKVAAVSEVVARDLIGRPATEAALELHHRLKRSREAWTTQQSLEGQRAEAQERFSQADREVAALSRLIEEMCREAGCTGPDELPDAEAQSQRRRALEADLASVNEQLGLLSGGAAIDAFISEALGVDPDGIEAHIGKLEEDVTTLARDISALDQTIGSERVELGRMDGGGAAAALAVEIQITLGGIEAHAERYVRLKIAAKVLNLAIERYRARSQGPTLNRASRLFGRITGGAFAGVRAEYDETGRPVMVGVRGDGQLLHVDAMSAGTADQLFLALRLAGLEMYLAQNEPIPFIVDDILIQFDNERACAALAALADLSEKTQILFFTHHHHLVEMAERSIPRARLFHHSLPLT